MKIGGKSALLHTPHGLIHFAFLIIFAYSLQNHQHDLTIENRLQSFF